MQDRLSDLRNVVRAKDAALVDLLPPGVSAVFETHGAERTDIGIFEAQIGVKSEPKHDAFMAEYLAQINTIKQGISDVQANGNEIRILKQKVIYTATPQEEKELSNRLQKILNETNGKILQVKKALEQLKESNDMFRPSNPNSSETRIRENMHAALTRKFRELLTEYQTLQTEYKKTVKDKIERQVKIVYPDATEHEIQEMVEGADSNVAQQAIYARMTGAHESLSYAYQDIQDKHRDVKRLEQSVAELHQMFVDMATLVEAQGELLDQIDFAVRNAKDYTEKADRDLVQAQKNQKKSQKWACWISTCLIILAIIVIMPIVVYVSK